MADPQINPNEISTTTVYLLLGRLEKMCEHGFEGMNDRLDKVNGRVGHAEQEIAVLKDRADQTKTRADEAADTADSARGSARWWSLGIASVIAGAAEVLRSYYGK